VLTAQGTTNVKRLGSIALFAALAILPAIAQAGQNGGSNQNYPNTYNSPSVSDRTEPTPPHDPQYDYFHHPYAPGQEPYVTPAAPDGSDDSGN